MDKVTTVEDYIVGFPTEVQELLRRMRRLILSEVPQAEESISYGMPAYKLNGKPLIYFGAYPKHIGLYALPNAHQHFAAKLEGYKQGKGSVQFPISAPLPFDLITEMIQFNCHQLRT